MNLKEQQKRLAQLYLKADVRKKLLQEGNTSLNTKEVEVFAKGLLMKRLNAVKALLPVSFQLDGNLLHEHFLTFGTTNSVKGAHLKHTLDALHFVRFLKRFPIDPYLKEVLRWEGFALEKALPATNFNCKLFYYDFAYATKDQMLSKKAKPKRCFLMIWRLDSRNNWNGINW